MRSIMNRIWVLGSSVLLLITRLAMADNVVLTFVPVYNDSVSYGWDYINHPGGQESDSSNWIGPGNLFFPVT
jgi:hypothetical protein